MASHPSCRIPPAAAALCAGSPLMLPRAVPPRFLRKAAALPHRPGKEGSCPGPLRFPGRDGPRDNSTPPSAQLSPSPQGRHSARPPPPPSPPAAPATTHRPQRRWAAATRPRLHSNNAFSRFKRSRAAWRPQRTNKGEGEARMGRAPAGRNQSEVFAAGGGGA